MPPIDGPSVGPYLVIEATFFDKSLSIVTGFAKRLQFSIPELEFVTIVRLDVVNHRSDLDLTLLCALSAKWLEA
jgi:hypothetical protein